MLDKIFPKIHDEGYKFISHIFIIVTIVLYFMHGFLGFVGLILNNMVFIIFLETQKEFQSDNENYLTSPADGLVVLQVLRNKWT